jgi:hypothetical protein
VDKTKIKNFAIDARRQLIEEITLKARLIGIRKDGIQDPTNETNEIQFFGEYSICITKFIFNSFFSFVALFLTFQNPVLN